MDIFEILKGKRIIVLSIDDERLLYTWTPSVHMLTLWKPIEKDDLNQWQEVSSIKQTDGEPIHTYGAAREAAAEWHDWHSKF